MYIQFVFKNVKKPLVNTPSYSRNCDRNIVAFYATFTLSNHSGAKTMMKYTHKMIKSYCILSISELISLSPKMGTGGKGT